MGLLDENGLQILWTKIKSLFATKQDTLVSGTNIKTVNGTSLLGEGDVSISGGSGGGDFDESGDYPNLTAGKATKLATARTISLSGGAVGTATAFDGSDDIDIPVTNIYDSYIAWGGKLIHTKISPLDATSPMFSANRFAFFPPESISVEYSTDGGVTWQDYGATSQSKILFTTPELGTTSYKIGNKTGSSSSASDMVRVTFNGEGCYRYARLNKILLHVNNCTAAAKAYITIETETYSGTVRENTYKYVQGVAGWNSIPLMYDFPFGNSNQTNVIKRLAITLKVESNVVTVPLLRNIFAIGNTSYNTQYPYDKNGHIYSFDIDQNATFPAKVTATKHVTQGGTSSQVVLGDGTLKALSELSGSVTSEGIIEALGFTPADAENVGNIERNVTSLSTTLDTKASKDVATTSANGLMSSTDKTKLDNIPSTDICSNIVEAVADGDNVELFYDMQYRSSDGTYSESENESILFPLATSSSAGMMSIADKIKSDLFTHTKEDVYGDSFERLTWNITEDPESGFINTYEQRIEKDDNYIVTHFEVFNNNGNKIYQKWFEVGDSDNYVTVSSTGIEGYFPSKYFILDSNGCSAEQFVKNGGTSTQILMADGSVKEVSEIGGGNGEDSRYSQFIDILTQHDGQSGTRAFIPIEETFINASWNDSSDDKSVTLYLDSGLYYDTDENKWKTSNGGDGEIPVSLTFPYATQDTAGIMSAADKAKLDSLSTSAGGGMTISGTVNLTNGTFNTTDNTSLTSYSTVFNDMNVGEMRMYLVSDSSGNLPSTSETYVTVPYDGVLSPAYLYFGKSAAFGVSVGDICVLFKRSSLLNVCRIIPLNDVKAADGDFPGADGLSTVWDKTRINKVDGIEWTANYVRDNYLPKNDRFPSRADWLIDVDNCLDAGVYPTCDTASLNVGWTNQYTTVVVQRTSTADNGGYHTIEQTAYGRGADEGQVYKRIIFYKSDGTDTQYGEWLLIVKQLVNIEVSVSDTDTFTNVFQTIAEYLENATEAEKGEVTVRHAAASVTLGNFTFTHINSGSYVLKGFIDPVFSENSDTNCTGVMEYGEIFLNLAINSEGSVYGKGASLVNGDTWTWEKSEV